jgi:methylglutaconyl-CoA hydratase
VPAAVAHQSAGPPQAGSATDKAVDIASKIIKNGPLGVRMAKKAISAGMQTDIHTGLEIEKACYAQVIKTKDRTEGLTAFREKRAPQYTGE